MLLRSPKPAFLDAVPPASADHYRAAAAKLYGLSDAQLCRAADDVRDLFSRGDRAAAAVETGLALALEALRRATGFDLYDVQLRAARVLAEGAVAEMETGEGKTMAAAAAAVIGALRGQAVHVATPNAYLADRDFHQLRPAFESLGISVGLLPEKAATSEQKKQAYECEVTYGTGYEFGFDYLRDQLAACTSTQKPLGANLLEKLNGDGSGALSLQRGQVMAIVDEVDNVLIDDAGSPLILSDAQTALAEDADACLLARRLVAQLRPEEHFRILPGVGVELTSQGSQAIHQPTISIPFKQLRRPWAEYVQQALRAQYIFRRDAHYVVDNGEIRIVDGSTGRIFSERTWSEGLHQAIEAREGLTISNERSALAQITRQRYYRLYSCLCGMTGTALGCEREFRLVYEMDVHQIPRRLACQRKIYPMRGFGVAEAKWAAIATEVQQQRQRGRPVLVGTRTILDSERLADLLRLRGLSFQLLNGRQDVEEAAIISVAGRAGAITIATNLAGRGTDICLDEVARKSGGLHVIVSEPHELARIDRQLRGRCARKGDPGSARTFVSAEDQLIQEFGCWLAGPIRRCLDSLGESRVDLTGRIRGIQRSVARQQAAARMALMRRDLARESLMSGLPDLHTQRR